MTEIRGFLVRVLYIMQDTGCVVCGVVVTQDMGDRNDREWVI